MGFDILRSERRLGGETRELIMEIERERRVQTYRSSFDLNHRWLLNSIGGTDNHSTRGEALEDEDEDD